MTEPEAVGKVVPHMFYDAYSYDRDVEGKTTPAYKRLVAELDKGMSRDVSGMQLQISGPALPPWIYSPRLFRVFSREARDVIDAHGESHDRIAFAACSAVLSDGSTQEVYIAIPTDVVDVLSPHSTNANGVAMWWALELSKLRDRTMFVVPHATSTTAMRGDLILALHELGWPCHVRPLRVMDGDHMVSYGDWANHPEWTGYAAH